MSDVEVDEATPSKVADTVSPETDIAKKSCADFFQEINTYDSIPVSTDNGKKQKIGILKKIYSFIAVLTVLLSVLFSSAEILDVILNDMGTGNAIIKRIFGKDISGDSFNLGELIISNSFLSLNDDITHETNPPSAEESKDEAITPVPNETVPESSLPQTPIETENEPPISTEPPSASEKNQFPILPMDMSLISYGEEYIYNNTSLSPDVTSLAKAKLNSYYTDQQPLVLIVHTHGTESYMPEGAKYYTDEGELARSLNTEENMIAVGRVFARVLEENGIKTVHCTVMHDKESYKDSYSRAAESIAKYLKQYPSIKYVFDLHRDSLMRSGGELISAVTTIDGESHAQIMPVIGAGAGDWKENMTFALKLRSMLNGKYTNLCRPICLRESTYNQNMAAISVLLEMGTSGNSLTEAKNTAILAAEAVAMLIKE